MKYIYEFDITKFKQVNLSERCAKAVWNFICPHKSLVKHSLIYTDRGVGFELYVTENKVCLKVDGI